MGKIKQQKAKWVVLSANPYDVAEVHKRANSTYIFHNIDNISFNPSKSSLIKFNVSNQDIENEQNVKDKVTA